MGNPYNQPTLSGYNDNAPADDGSNVASNEITWAKHKDKLGDPLKSFAESIDSNVSTAFSKRLFNSVSSISSDYTVVAGDRGKLLSTSNTITITLLPAGTAGSGFELVIRNDGSGTVTVDGDGSETVNGSTTVDLEAGASIFMVSDGSNWVGHVGHDNLAGLTATASELNNAISSEGVVDATNGGANDLSEVDFTSISSSAQRITIIFDDVGIASGAALEVVIGDSDGFETSGYVSFTDAVAASSQDSLSNSDSFAVSTDDTGAGIDGICTLVKLGTNNTWIEAHNTITNDKTFAFSGAGSKSLSKALDRVRVSANASTFNSGNVNVLVE